jgi:pimeloyl-ACP methyl ester carboxylesterase
MRIELWLLAAVLLLAALLLAGRLYQALGARRDRLRYPPPGRLCRGLHLYSLGEGSLPVLFEAGVGATSISWRRMQQEVARFTRTISYDRMGLGWSGAPQSARLVSNLLLELDAALAEAGLTGPLVLVGHSFGGFLMRHFAAAYPQRVAAVVLVDPLEPEEYWPLGNKERHDLSRGALLARYGARLARAGVVRLALNSLMSGARFLPKLIANATSSPRGASFLERLIGEVRKLPEETWPAVRSHWCTPKNFLALAAYLEALPRNCAQRPDDAALRNIPLWLISAGDLPDARRAGHARTAQISARATHLIASDAGHWVHLDAPDLVLNAIREAWLATRPPSA